MIIESLLINQFYGKNMSYIQANHNLFWQNIAQITYTIFELNAGVLDKLLKEDHSLSFQSLD